MTFMARFASIVHVDICKIPDESLYAFRVQIPNSRENLATQQNDGKIIDHGRD